MNIQQPITAVSSRAKCICCGAPIIKGEGVLKVRKYYDFKYTHSGSGYFCYKCASMHLTKARDGFDKLLKELQMRKELTDEELDAQKMIRKL
ncbi:hypothetical protein KY320_01520 [Candidatus Woesearchaeota archaeon]|nr:hypothetical protein [Candidatus Woesearchaeota archaeon]